MPAHPLVDETLQRMAAVRAALAEHLGADAKVQERMLLGSHALMVNGRLWRAVRHADLLVRLPAAAHAAMAEAPGVRALGPRGGMPGYFRVEQGACTTQARWQRRMGSALAWNLLAKAPHRRRTNAGAAAKPQTAAARQPLRSWTTAAPAFKPATTPDIQAF